tara:strand:- start:216 stop:659 length:444 start_codon:yes stop_codon:yes gene_type:complete
MKYLLGILILFSGLSFSIPLEELRERYQDINEEDTLLVCDEKKSANLEYRFLLIISEISELASVERYNRTYVEYDAKLMKVIETASEFKITSKNSNEGVLLSIDRFTLEMRVLAGKWQCRKVNKFDYRLARLELMLMVENIKLDRKI